MWHSVVDEYSVDIFHVREADEFVDSGIVADVAFQFWIGLIAFRFLIVLNGSFQGTPVKTVTCTE